MRKWYRQIKKWSIRVGVALALLLLFANIWIVESTRARVLAANEVDEIHEVALILGTSPKKKNGHANPFFEDRIDLAARLYKAGKVKHFLVSGDNRTAFYNEPLEMQKALMARGIPQDAVTLDYAGLRTLDSMVRSKEVFGRDSILVITQAFHSYRALFIGDHYGMNSVAVVPEELPIQDSLWVRFRELLARPLAVWDLYLVGKRPRHLGPLEKIEVN